MEFIHEFTYCKTKKHIKHNFHLNLYKSINIVYYIVFCNDFYFFVTHLCIIGQCFYILSRTYLASW